MEQLREELFKARLAEKTARDKLQEIVTGPERMHTEYATYEPSDVALTSWHMGGANGDLGDPVDSNQLSLEMEKERLVT